MANEKRRDLIDRQDLIKAVQKKLFAIGDNTHPYKAIEIQGKYFRECVDNAPTVDAVEVVHARWEERYIPNGKYVAWDGFYCSVCGNKAAKSHYCPNCGAIMVGGNDQ